MRSSKILALLTVFVLLATGCQSAATTLPPATSTLSPPTTTPVPTEGLPLVPTGTPAPTKTLPPAPTETPAPTPTSAPKAQPWRPVLPKEPCTPSETRTCQVLFVLPAQYYAESGRRFPDQFRDAGYEVTVASDAPQVVEVCGNTVGPDQPSKNIPVDLHLAEVQVADYDAVVFIGGLGCQDQWHDEEAHRIAQEAVSQGKVLGAAGCASTILAHAGVLQGKTAAVCSGNPPVKHGEDYCAVLESLGAVCSDAEIARDGLIVTARQKSRYFVAGVIEVILESGAASGSVSLLQKSPQEFDKGTFQIGLGDLDGDGDLDAVFANPQRHNSEVWLNDGKGVFADTGQQLTPYGHGVGVADFDGDGDLDAFIACHQFVEPSKIYLNDGKANFHDTGQDLGDAKSSGVEVNLIDLNGDGNIDVHVAYYDPQGLPDKVYLNDGAGVFADSGLALNEETIAWGDLDGDGDVDYFGKRWGQGYVVQLNDGSGQFTEGWHKDDSQPTVGGVALADWDGDGDLDALVANGFRTSGNYPTLLLWNDGAGQFSDSGLRFNETDGAELGVGDLDGDGDLDVFVSNTDFPNEVWLYAGDGQFSDSGLRLGDIPPQSFTTKPSLGDLTCPGRQCQGDGDRDLDVFVGSLEGRPEIWFNVGAPGEIAEELNVYETTETYLGEIAPGSEPVVFRPGSVSTEVIEMALAVHPNLQEVYFTRLAPQATILVSRQTDDGWTTPEPVSFSSEYDDAGPFIAADGQKLYFSSKRPASKGTAPREHYQIWAVERVDEGWSNPAELELPIQSVGGEASPSVTRDGTLYYVADYPSLGGEGLYRSELVNGKYQMPEKLDVLANAGNIVEVEPFIAPDESFLLFYSAGRPDNLTPNGKLGDLYISFKESTGQWTEPQNLGQPVNSAAEESTPSVSPDGKYLFFASNRNASNHFPDIYWVRAEFLDNLEPAAPTNTPVPPTLTPAPASTELPVPTGAPTVKRLHEWADLKTGKGPVYSQSWSPDGRWLVTADYDQVKVWDITSHQEAGVLVGHTSFVWGLAWSPDGSVLASASQDGSVRLWDVTALTETAALETGWAFCVAWSPDGTQLAVGNKAGRVQIWGVGTGQLLDSWQSAPSSPIISVAWSPDGKTIASGAWGGEIDLWDVEMGQVRTRLAGYTTNRCDVNGLAWSPDGSTLASAHQDGQVRLWDVETGQMVRAIKAHTGWARGVAWSPGGRLLASTGEDKRICLWHPETGQEYAEEHHNRLPVWSVAWSPDGTQVASGAGAYEQPHVGATIVWTVP